MATSAGGESASGSGPGASDDAWEKSKDAFVSYVVDGQDEEHEMKC